VGGLGENRTILSILREGNLLRRAVWAIAVSMTFLSASAWCRDIALVSNKTTPITTIAMADLVKVCKAQMSHWSNGKAVTLVTRSPEVPEMRLVLEKIYGMTPEAVSSLIVAANHEHISRPLIVVVNSDEDVVKKVEETPGAVGFADVYSITGAVQVVKVGGKLPLEPGYVLHGN
jgi:hypothetical protein